MRVLVIAVLVTVFSILTGCSASAEKKEMARSHYLLGQSKLQSGNTQNAYIEFHKALEFNPRNKEVHYALGYVNMKNKDYKIAHEHLSKAVKIAPNYSEAWNTMCFLDYMYLKDYDGAIAACQEALKNPLYTTPEKPLYTLGRIHYLLGNNTKALKYFTKTVNRFPSFFFAYYSQALAYNALGQRTEASEAIAIGIELNPDFQGDTIKAEKFIRKNRTNKAYFSTTKEADLLIQILHY